MKKEMKDRVSYQKNYKISKNNVMKYLQNMNN